MIKIIYSKDSKKSLDSYDKKTSSLIIKAIDDIPLGDIVSFSVPGTENDTYLFIDY